MLGLPFLIWIYTIPAGLFAGMVISRVLRINGMDGYDHPGDFTVIVAATCWPITGAFLLVMVAAAGIYRCGDKAATRIAERIATTQTDDTLLRSAGNAPADPASLLRPCE